MPPVKSVSVFEYLDYRRFLSDFCERKKAVSRSFSYRALLKKADIPSSGYLSEVLTGKRDLSEARARKFARALALSAKEEVFLLLLVDFAHAQSESGRRAVYDAMLQAMPVKSRRLRESQLDYFSRWHFVAVREALSIIHVKEDYRELAALVLPSITADEAREAVRTMECLDLVARDAEGCWRACQPSVAAGGGGAPSALLRTFQREMIRLAGESLDSIPASDRNISCATLSVSGEGMSRINAALEEFRQRVMEIIHSDSHEDRVVQLNMQLFPVSRVTRVDRASPRNPAHVIDSESRHA